MSALSDDAVARVLTPDAVLFVFLRPIDAVISAGGTIALAARSGAPVTVLTALPGDASDGQVASAMRAIGAADHRVLGGADARMHGAGERSYAASGSPLNSALASADPGEIAADIATVIATVGARTVIADTDAAGDPERVSLSRAARHAATVMDVDFHRVAVAAEHSREASRTERVELDAGDLDRKRRAIDALGGGELASAEAFVGDDHEFPEAEPERPVTWSEFGVPTRITALVVGLVLGAVVGALGTVVYQSGPMIGTILLPLGLIGSLLVVTAILAGLRMVFETRAITAAAAIGVLGVIGILSLESPGGSVLIPQAPLSYYWIYGPVLIAFVVLAWPDLRRFRRVRIAEPLAPKGNTAP